MDVQLAAAIVGRQSHFGEMIKNPRDHLRGLILNYKWRCENIRDDLPIETERLIVEQDFGARLALPQVAHLQLLVRGPLVQSGVFFRDVLSCGDSVQAQIQGRQCQSVLSSEPFISVVGCHEWHR